MKPGVWSVLAGALAALSLAACDRADQSKLESDAKKAWNGTKQAARKAGAEIKRETKEVVAQANETLKDVGETTGQVVEDATLTAKVKAALHAEKDVKSRAIDVETFQGKVVLKGAVPDRRQAELAAQVARSIEGVKSVENRLTVN